tara:strand:+ start:9920 stop:10729 length:810 start_codon:yes stop_codon:yes gene_type:complete
LSNTIGIIGCGWLGFPLAQAFLVEKYNVKGTTTSDEKLNLLEKEGIKSYLISLSEHEIDGAIHDFLKDVKTLIINVPPKLRGTNKENYVAKMRLLYSAIKVSTIENIVFVSSTSVYGDFDGAVTEKTKPEPTTESGKQLLKSEAIFQNDADLKTTIIRFGGLISQDRHPVTMLAKRQGLENGNMPVNLIHRVDCIRIITAVVKNNWWQQIINGVYPDHPTKKEYYTQEAKRRGIQLPDYKAETTKKGKIISSDYLLNVKKFHFLTSIKN